MLSIAEKQDVAVALNLMLCSVRNEEDFKRLQAEVVKACEKSHIEYQGVRKSRNRGNQRFSFTNHKGKCHYLIDDGISTGYCEYKNLYRSIRIVVF